MHRTLSVMLAFHLYNNTIYSPEVSVAVINIMTKGNLGEARVYFTLQLSDHLTAERNQGQRGNLEAKTEGRSHGGCCLLVSSSGLAQWALLNNSE